MVEEKFILASLEDPESKELAQVIASNTARKILGLLSKEDMSETDISNKLNIPLTTAHYNIQQLLRAKLIETKQFKWSDKGKKIHYYKISNKLIIIAPKSQGIFLDKIKSIIPVALISFAGAGLIYLFSSKLGQKVIVNFPQRTAEIISKEATSVAAGAPTFTTIVGATETVNITQEAITLTAPKIINIIPNYALWFLFGALVAIISFLIIFYLRSRK